MMRSSNEASGGLYRACCWRSMQRPGSANSACVQPLRKDSSSDRWPPDASVVGTQTPNLAGGRALNAWLGVMVGSRMADVNAMTHPLCDEDGSKLGPVSATATQRQNLYRLLAVHRPPRADVT